MTIRAVIFDVYGTLLEVGPPPPDAEQSWQELWNRILHAGPRLSRLEFSGACNRIIARRHEAARARGIPWPEINWPSVVLEAVPELKGVSVAEQEEFVFEQMQTGRTTWMRREAAELLVRLRAAERVLGIASNSQAYTLRELQQGLAPHGLGLDLLNPELCFWSHQHGFSKPDPHVFQVLSARLEARGIPPNEILMVGERLDNDITPARAHGWRAWQLPSPGQAGDGDWLQLAAALLVPAQSAKSK